MAPSATGWCGHASVFTASVICPRGTDEKKDNQADSADRIVQYLASDMYRQQHQQSQRQGVPQQTQSSCTARFISPETHQGRYRQTGPHFRCDQCRDNIGHSRSTALQTRTGQNSEKKKHEAAVFENTDHHRNGERPPQRPGMPTLVQGI